MKKMPAFVEHFGKTYLCQLGQVFDGCNTFVLDIVSGPHNADYVNKHNTGIAPLDKFYLSVNGYPIERVQELSIGLSLKGKILQKI